MISVTTCGKLNYNIKLIIILPAGKNPHTYSILQQLLPVIWCAHGQNKSVCIDGGRDESEEGCGAVDGDM